MNRHDDGKTDPKTDRERGLARARQARHRKSRGGDSNAPSARETPEEYRRRKQEANRRSYLRKKGYDIPFRRSGPERGAVAGSANPNWKGDVAPSVWAARARARALLPPSSGACERCGSPGEEIHHRDRNPLNEARENLERLCRPCHIMEHRYDGRDGRPPEVLG